MDNWITSADRGADDGGGDEKVWKVSEDVCQGEDVFFYFKLLLDPFVLKSLKCSRQWNSSPVFHSLEMSEKHGCSSGTGATRSSARAAPSTATFAIR